MLNIKDLFDVFKQAGKIEEYQKILDLIDDSFKDKEKIQELIEKNTKLKEEKKELSEKLNLLNDLKFENNAYWKKSDNDGPFCLRCWDKNKEVIRIPFEKKGWSVCYECKNKFNLTGKERENCAVIL